MNFVIRNWTLNGIVPKSSIYRGALSLIGCQGQNKKFELQVFKNRLYTSNATGFFCNQVRLQNKGVPDLQLELTKPKTHLVELLKKPWIEMGRMTGNDTEESKQTSVKDTSCDEMNVDIGLEENGSRVETQEKDTAEPIAPDGLTEEALSLDTKQQEQTTCKKRKLTIDEEGNTYERLGQDINKANERMVEFLISSSKVVENLEEGRLLIDEIMLSKATVSVDCEGVNLGDRRSGKVTLVQVGVVDGLQAKALLFDVQEEPKLAKELERLLESEDIVKVMHDCRADSEGLHHQFGIQIRSIFDTQSGHIVIKQNCPDFTKADKQIGLDKVCEEYGGLPNQFKETVKGLYRKDQRIWSRRPLTTLLISYAASDVLCLVPTVYNEMNRRISSEEDQKLMAELSNKQISHTRDKSTHSRPVNHSRQQQHHRHHHYQPRRGSSRGRPYY